MSLLFVSHSACSDHKTPPAHPENPLRLDAVRRAVSGDEFTGLSLADAPRAPLDVIELAHPDGYISAIKDAMPDEGLAYIDPDTSVSRGSWEASRRAVGAVSHGVDAVMTGKSDAAFCAVRPPGHHAEANRPMGFCLFSNIAIGALYARAKHGAERVAVIDFDVHHGNGTQDIFEQDADLFYGSTHQSPLFPGTGRQAVEGVGNIFNAPLPGGAGGSQFREAMKHHILPALEAFSPDLILISAGFDAHRDDPLAGLNLLEADFGWITKKLVDIAHRQCDGRLVSVLEGGYDLKALENSARSHLRALHNGAT